ncbi:hypothetical protein A9Q94_15615 [Rhodobacterales bacterium 56_14_T64]|nr:hypothetical protein A9Q94_15615 [Rhodobacterales bacterium 56_14_T64]
MVVGTIAKAIYGAAHRIHFPEDGEIITNAFSGCEQFVQVPLEALGFKFVAMEQVAIAKHGSGVEAEISITSEDALLITSSRSKQRYADRNASEHEAYVRVSFELKSLGNLLQPKLTNLNKFEVRTV